MLSATQTVQAARLTKALRIALASETVPHVRMSIAHAIDACEAATTRDALEMAKAKASDALDRHPMQLDEWAVATIEHAADGGKATITQATLDARAANRYVPARGNYGAADYGD
jgi:hypothetical protein